MTLKLIAAALLSLPLLVGAQEDKPAAKAKPAARKPAAKKPAKKPAAKKPAGKGKR